MNNHYTVKELPESERPYEKVEKYGAAFLSDAELLAVIIKTGTKNERSTEVASRLLNLSNEDGFGGLARLDVKDYKKVKGIGRIKAIQLACLFELSNRIAEAKRKEGLSLFSPNSIAEYYMPRLKDLKKEETYCLYADSKSRIISEEKLTIGTVNSSLLSPREIFISAIKKEAVFIFILHNHPSGDPTPSKDDILITKRIQDAGEIIGIKILDHIIIGDNVYTSMKDKGYL